MRTEPVTDPNDDDTRADDGDLADHADLTDGADLTDHAGPRRLPRPRGSRHRGRGAGPAAPADHGGRAGAGPVADLLNTATARANGSHPTDAWIVSYLQSLPDGAPLTPARWPASPG
ncbi:hypothetical protein NKH77_31730 [Streptomyces sp. M19]